MYVSLGGAGEGICPGRSQLHHKDFTFRSHPPVTPAPGASVPRRDAQDPGAVAARIDAWHQFSSPRRIRLPERGVYLFLFKRLPNPPFFQSKNTV